MSEWRRPIGEFCAETRCESMMHTISSNKSLALYARHRIHAGAILAFALLFLGLGGRAGSCQPQVGATTAEELPKAVAHGTAAAPGGRRESGDTRILHVPPTDDTVPGGERLVELVVNGRVAARESVPADGRVHELRFDVPIERSSWVALRHFPQMHTNPVNVIVANQPVRASRESARWCAEAVELLWENRSRRVVRILILAAR